jgi:hypothetical protein
MINFTKAILSISLCLLSTISANSQGCSDAGFCTAGSIKPTNQSGNAFKNSIGFTLGYALGERGTQIITPQFEPNIRINDRSMVQIKIPMVFIKGDLASVNGLGDAILSYNYLFDSLAKYPIMLTVGTRIATGTASLKNENIPLPMPYQLSLGTTDLILGAKMELKKGFSVSVAYQQPVFNRNQNGFDSVAFKNLARKENLLADDNFFISSNIKRKGDVLVRIDKAFKTEKTFTTIGILPIIHLGKDEVEFAKNKTTKLDGSQGLTLNINTAVYYKLTTKTEISLILAMPIIVRESRPDGLTRAFVSVAGLRYFL